VTNTSFVADAKLDPTTYEPLPGSPTVGQAIPVANAPDYTGTIWANRRTAGALETLKCAQAVVPGQPAQPARYLGPLPTGTYQDAAKTIAAGVDGNPVGGWVGQFEGAELTRAAPPDRRSPRWVGNGRWRSTVRRPSNAVSVPTDGGLTMAFVVDFQALGTILYSDSNSNHWAIVDSTAGST